MTGSVHFTVNVHRVKRVYSVILMMPVHQIHVMKAQFAKQVLSTALTSAPVHRASREPIALRILTNVWMALLVNMGEVASIQRDHLDVNVSGASQGRDVKST